MDMSTMMHPYESLIILINHTFMPIDLILIVYTWYSIGFAYE